MPSHHQFGTGVARGSISFVFDDGYQEIYQHVVPLLDHYQLPGVFAIPLDEHVISKTEHQPTAPLNDWLALQQRGHEIAAHSINHLDLTTLAAEQLEQQLKEPHTKLNATTLVYPGGAFNDTVASAAAKHYLAARTVVRGLESLSPADPLRLKSFNFTRRNFSVFRANALALYAWLTNSWLIETYHLIHTAERKTNASHSVPFADFKRHVSFVARLPLAVETIQTVIQRSRL